MDFNQIVYFLQLCEDKSISRAAKNLYITQQGLSKSIKKLETEVAFPLFERGKSGMFLTKRGRAFRHYALEFRDIQVRMQDCVDRLRQDEQKVRVGTTMGVIISLHASALDDLRRAVSPTLVEFVDTTDFACENEVESGNLDLGITVAPVDETRFYNIPLKRHAMYAVINEAHPLASRSTIGFDDLRDERFIVANPNFKTYYNFIERCEAHGFHPNIASTTMEMMVIYAKSRQNQGIGISADLPCGIVECPGVALVPFHEDEFPWQLSLIIPRRKILTEREQRVRDALLEYIR